MGICEICLKPSCYSSPGIEGNIIVVAKERGFDVNSILHDTSSCISKDNTRYTVCGECAYRVRTIFANGQDPLPRTVETTDNQVAQLSYTVDRSDPPDSSHRITESTKKGTCCRFARQENIS
jgi:hypothetical protein